MYDMKRSNFVQMHVLGALLHKASKTSLELLPAFEFVSYKEPPLYLRNKQYEAMLTWRQERFLGVLYSHRSAAPRVVFASGVSGRFQYETQHESHCLQKHKISNGLSAPNLFILSEHTQNTHTTYQRNGTKRVSISLHTENESICFTAVIGMAEREIEICCKTAVFTRAWSFLYELSVLLPLVKQQNLTSIVKDFEDIRISDLMRISPLTKHILDQPLSNDYLKHNRHKELIILCTHGIRPV